MEAVRKGLSPFLKMAGVNDEPLNLLISGEVLLLLKCFEIMNIGSRGSFDWIVHP